MELNADGQANQHSMLASLQSSLELFVPDHDAPFLFISVILGIFDSKVCSIFYVSCGLLRVSYNLLIGVLIFSACSIIQCRFVVSVLKT